MAARGYEFYLLVLTRERYSGSLLEDKIQFVSPRGHVISSIFHVRHSNKVFTHVPQANHNVHRDSGLVASRDVK